MPRTALKTDVNGNYVWVVQDGKARRVRVKVAPSSDNANPQVPITAGVAAGALVLTLRGTEPNEGQLVALPGAVPAAAAPAAAPAAKS